MCVPPSDDETSEGRRTIFLAEDDDEIRCLLRMGLEGDGYRVHTASRGTDLLDALRRADRRPELIITDIRMPGASGLDVVQEVRSWGWAMPIIVITAFGDSETLDHADRVGASMVFNKPFDLDDLRTAALHLLRDWPTPYSTEGLS
jgi:DNA-binding NtrC family response regulator